MLLSYSDMKIHAKNLLRSNGNSSKFCFNRKFRSNFGVSLRVATKTWNSLSVQKLLPDKSHPKHILWMCAFLKTYNSESVYATWYGVGEKCFRKWVWLFLASVAELEIVSKKLFFFYIIFSILLRII
jgi:hypothetical protein